MPPAQSPVVEPLSPARYKVQFTASSELRDKLERLQALLHTDLAAVIEVAGHREAGAARIQALWGDEDASEEPRTNR